MNDRMPLLSHKWTGPVCSILGIAMLGSQVYLFLSAGLLSAWLIGGGVGMLFVGIIAWLHYVGDKRSRAPESGEFPSAEEYEANFPPESTVRRSRVGT